MPDRIIVSVDAMGGDNAPDIVVEGINHFRKTDMGHRGLRFLLHGDEETLTALLAKNPEAQRVCRVQHTDKAISMDEKPSQALRKGKDSSMWNAIASVKAGEAGVAISAGNTGALMAISKLQLRMKDGVERPAIAASWPRRNGQCVVLDVGANIECDDRQLAEFAILGEAFYRALYHKKRPTIGLLNVGTEELKGNAVIRAADQRLRLDEVDLDYRGFVEGDDISMGNVDVIVTDGYTGNIALKTAEGTAKLVGSFVKQALDDGFTGWMAKIINGRNFKKLKTRMDPRSVNGGVFLGLNGVVVKSHGGTDHIGFANAIAVAVEMAFSDFEKEIERSLMTLHQAEETMGNI